MRVLQAAGQVEAPLGLAEQAGPELAELVQGKIETAAEALIQLCLAADAVVPQTQLQPIDRPSLARSRYPALEHRRLAA
ncbi:hypothetical protein FQZ97_1245340 [compost metagenome]